MERTLVLIKPDGVKRSISGKIISRFEDSGLKIIAMKMFWVDEKFAQEHYKLDEEWAKSVFHKTKTTREGQGNPFPFKDHMEYGKMIQRWNMDFLKEGPVIAIVLQGPHAIEIVRKIAGSTEPRQAAPGTIRSDFASIESYAVANDSERVLRNLIHASDSLETAKREIALWFSKDELHSDYETSDELLLKRKMQNSEDADEVDGLVQRAPFFPEAADGGVGRGDAQRDQADQRGEADGQIKAEHDFARDLGKIVFLVDDIEREM